jgi:hypothetical protein
MRALFRCVNGAAIVLLKMGRYKESFDRYKQLEKLDNHGYQYSTHTNFRCAHLSAGLFGCSPLPNTVCDLGYWEVRKYRLENEAYLYSGV